MVQITYMHVNRCVVCDAASTHSCEELTGTSPSCHVVSGISRTCSVVASCLSKMLTDCCSVVIPCLQILNKSVGWVGLWGMVYTYLPGVLVCYMQLLGRRPSVRLPTWFKDWMDARKQLGLLSLAAGKAGSACRVRVYVCICLCARACVRVKPSVLHCAHNCCTVWHSLCA